MQSNSVILYELPWISRARRIMSQKQCKME